MTHVTCRLTAKNRDQPRNPTLGSRVWAAGTFVMYAFRDGSECRWLRESHFQRDLQTDNIDADVVLEELQAVRADRTALT